MFQTWQKISWKFFFKCFFRQWQIISWNYLLWIDHSVSCESPDLWECSTKSLEYNMSNFISFCAASISRQWPLPLSSTSRIKAGPLSPLPPKHLSTLTHRGLKMRRVLLMTAQGETQDMQTHTVLQCWTELTDCLILWLQPRDLRLWCRDKQESELADVLWEARLVQTASAGEEVPQGEGERRRR